MLRQTRQINKMEYYKLMNLQVEKNEKHFYLYCAMFYKNNRTIDSNDVVSEVSTKVIEVLTAINFRKIDMPMHSYHYLMGLYNPDGYVDNSNTMKQPQEVTDYINELSNIPQLQDLFKQQESELDQKLIRYEEEFDYITKHFNTYFDFEPKDKSFILTKEPRTYVRGFQKRASFACPKSSFSWYLT